MPTDVWTFKDILDFAGGASGFSLVLLALIGGARKWWVFGWTYTDLRADLIEARTLHRESLDNLRRAIELIDRPGK